MKPPESKSPGGPAPGQERERTANEPWLNSNPFTHAAAKLLIREIWIIQNAARAVACYRAISHADYERVDQACGHVLNVLAAMYGREILQ